MDPVRHAASCRFTLKLILQETWSGLEKAVDQGLVRSIGVSNFSPQKIDALFKDARIQPAVNQVTSSAGQECITYLVLPSASRLLGRSPWPAVADPTVASEVLGQRRGFFVAYVLQRKLLNMAGCVDFFLAGGGSSSL